MPAETVQPRSFADLVTSPAYPSWAKPEPVDAPTRHRRTYTFLRGIASVWDRIVDAATSAAYCHGSQTAPTDALDDLGDTYGGLARAQRDDDVSFRAYLRNPLSRWYKFGTREGLLGELAHLGYLRAEVVSWRDLVDAGAAPPNVVFGGNTGFFFVAIYAPSPLSDPGIRWVSSSARWGDGSLWAGPAGTARLVAELERVIQLVKPAHTSCRFITVFRDLASGLNALKLPQGRYRTYPLNEPWERVRPSFALNPFYTSDPLVP